jgi:type II secretory pathway pseudopilin PulG
MRINRFKNKQDNGFTLIELILFMAMFSVILIVLSSLFSAIVEKQLETESVSTVENDSKFITSRLIYDISRADSITTPAALGAQSASLSIVISGVTFTYAISNGDLELTQGVETNDINSTGTTISGLNFTRLGNSTGKHTVQVTYTITSDTVVPSGPETKTISTVIGTR